VQDSIPTAYSPPGADLDSQQTIYEARNHTTRQRPYPNKPFPIPTDGARPFGVDYKRCAQYPLDAQQPYPNTNGQYVAQQASLPHESPGSQYQAVQTPYANANKRPYLLEDAKVSFELHCKITDPRLYDKGIHALAQVSIDQNRKKSKFVL